MQCFEAIQILLGEFHCLYINLENFQNDEIFWSILFKLNLENFKWHLKAKNFKFFRYYDFSNFAFWSSNFSKLTNWPQFFLKIVNWPLKIFKKCNLTPNFILQIWPKKIKIYKSCPKMMTMNFFITPSKQ